MCSVQLIVTSEQVCAYLCFCSHLGSTLNQFKRPLNLYRFYSKRFSVTVKVNHFNFLIWKISLLAVWWNFSYVVCFPSENQSWCCWTCSRCLRDRRAGWPSTSPRPPTTGSSTPAATWAYASTWRPRRVGASLGDTTEPPYIAVQ